MTQQNTNQVMRQTVMKIIDIIVRYSYTLKGLCRVLLLDEDKQLIKLRIMRELSLNI